MKKSRTLALQIVIAHWIVAITHLFFAAKVLPPNNAVSGLAVMLLSLGHFVVFVAVSKLGPKLSGAILVIFFIAAMTADLYEHFLHASANNVFLVAPNTWVIPFDASILILLSLEVVGCILGALCFGVRSHPSVG